MPKKRPKISPDTIVLSSFAVCGGKCGSFPCPRPLQRQLAARHFRQRGDPSGIPDRRAHEIQVRLQVQDPLPGAANGDGAAAGLRQVWPLTQFFSVSFL